MDGSGIFIDYSIRKLRQHGGRIAECVGRLSEDQIWARGTDNENAIGNLVLHLSGNVRQWIVSAVGGRPDTRRRDEEFAAVMEALPAERLTQQIRVQDYDTTVLEAIYHVVEHFSGHAGQILYITKLLTGEDLGFYRHLQTTAAHSEQTP